MYKQKNKLIHIATFDLIHITNTKMEIGKLKRFSKKFNKYILRAMP